MKGNNEPVRAQRFDYTNPDLKCMLFAGGLGPSKWTAYYGALYLAEIWSHICVKDESYFTAKKIKQLARSLGIETDETHSTKLNADPPGDLKMDLSMFTEITGKRNDYSIGSKQGSESQNQQSDLSGLQSIKDSNGTLEKKLIKLKDLFEKKLINKEEYESEKKEILNQF